MLGLVVHAVNSIQSEHKAFEKHCDSLPPEEAEKLRQARREQFQKEDEHRKKLEIAKAGRARNFWGN